MVAVSALLEGPCLTLKSQAQLREGVKQNAGQVLWSLGSRPSASHCREPANPPFPGLSLWGALGVTHK